MYSHFLNIAELRLLMAKPIGYWSFIYIYAIKAKSVSVDIHLCHLNKICSTLQLMHFLCIFNAMTIFLP